MERATRRLAIRSSHGDRRVATAPRIENQRGSERTSSVTARRSRGACASFLCVYLRNIGSSGQACRLCKPWRRSAITTLLPFSRAHGSTGAKKRTFNREVTLRQGQGREQTAVCRRQLAARQRGARRIRGGRGSDRGRALPRTS